MVYYQQIDWVLSACFGRPNAVTDQKNTFAIKGAANYQSKRSIFISNPFGVSQKTQYFKPYWEDFSQNKPFKEK